ncbi:DUF5995 family protein [Longibacter sp.]|uniref:DUF5995 family protein n=1 Tax=Longibacter sp. TaxID=2045415 RepID=UPI003EB7CBC0
MMTSSDTPSPEPRDTARPTARCGRVDDARLDDAALLGRMETHLRSWPEDQGRRVFLECYLIMTRNMLAGVHGRRFGDGRWVHRLLHRFAAYYFDALDAYERTPSSAPPVWQLAFEVTDAANRTPVQHLLLGVNAHINYDLVLTLEEVLAPEWPDLEPEHRATRYADHCGINRVIADSIDAVQDTVLEPRMGVLGAVDVVLGPLDEMLVSRLITSWREDVWHNAQDLLACRCDRDRKACLQSVEDDAMRIGERLI